MRQRAIRPRLEAWNITSARWEPPARARMGRPKATRTLIREIREGFADERGVLASRAAVARMLGVAAASVFNWENDRARPHKWLRVAIESLADEARKRKLNRERYAEPARRKRR